MQHLTLGNVPPQTAIGQRRASMVWARLVVTSHLNGVWAEELLSEYCPLSLFHYMLGAFPLVFIALVLCVFFTVLLPPDMLYALEP